MRSRCASEHLNKTGKLRGHLGRLSCHSICSTATLTFNALDDTLRNMLHFNLRTALFRTKQMATFPFGKFLPSHESSHGFLVFLEKRAGDTADRILGRHQYCFQTLITRYWETIYLIYPSLCFRPFSCSWQDLIWKLRARVIRDIDILCH